MKRPTITKLQTINALVAKFPKTEGYNVTATKWTNVGTTIYDTLPDKTLPA